MNLARSGVSDLLGPAAVVAVAGGAFTLLADSVTEGDGPASLDPTVAGDVVEHRTGVLTSIAHLLSFAGSEIVLGVLSVGLVVVLLDRRGPRWAILAAGTMGASAALTVGVKTAFTRARPGAADRLGPFDSTYSFPSGHTLNSAVFLGLVCLLVVPLLSRRARLGAYGVAALLAAGVGLSRVYLGYHWTTDVLASWTIAAMLLTVVHVVDRILSARARQSGGVQVERATVDS